jgi:membrane-associated protein
VYLITAALVPIISTLTEESLTYGIWMYPLLFIVIMIASTIFGGLIPDNTILFLTGAVALDNGLSMDWLFVMAVGGGFVGYEINYWSGRLFGITICRGVCPVVLHKKNVRKALDMMNQFGSAALILSRVMPVMNLPSFIAGVNAMDYRRFIGFNLISSAVWGGTLLTLGYYFGSIPLLNEYLDLLAGLLLVIITVALILVFVVTARDYVKQNSG